MDSSSCQTIRLEFQAEQQWPARLHLCIITAFGLVHCTSVDFPVVEGTAMMLQLRPYLFYGGHGNVSVECCSELKGLITRVPRLQRLLQLLVSNADLLRNNSHP